MAFAATGATTAALYFLFTKPDVMWVICIILSIIYYVQLIVPDVFQLVDFEEQMPSTDAELSFTFIFSLNKSYNPEPWEKIDPSKPQKVTSL